MRTKDQTNIWGDVIICLLQMCRDFPRGVVNVNPISRDIITLLRRWRRRRRKRRRRYFLLTRFESLGGTWRQRVAHRHFRSSNQIQNKQKKNGGRLMTERAHIWSQRLGGWQRLQGHVDSQVCFHSSSRIGRERLHQFFYFMRNKNKGFFFISGAVFPEKSSKGAGEATCWRTISSAGTSGGQQEN